MGKLTDLPCRESATLGCPDHPVKLICHQTWPHPGRDHFDAQEQLWWRKTGAEPELYEEPDLFGTRRRKG